MADQSVPLESEAKLLVPTVTELRSIARLGQLGPYPLQARGAVRLHSIYLDTPALTLARNGVALRLRRQGREWEATLKWSGRVRGIVHERPELTIALPQAPQLPFRLPPGPLYTQLAALAAGRRLEPVLVSKVHRRLLDVMPPDGAASAVPLAELALDQVRLHAPQEGQPGSSYCEIEVERRKCSKRDLDSLARLLLLDFGLLPSGDSKFARGLMLLYGPGIVGSDDQHVTTGDTLQLALRRIVARYLHQMRLHDPGVRIGNEPEALHQMRVAIRRLRAVFRIFSAGLPAQMHVKMSAELKWLGGLLGSVRDLDVQLATLADFSTAAPAGFRPALDRLYASLDDERSRRRTVMLASLDTTRYFRLLRQLERFAYGRPARRPRDAAAREPVITVGRRAIDRTFRGLIKRGNRIQATPFPEDLHMLRLRAKRLRYLLEFLQDLTGKPGRRMVRRLTELQDLLGSYHDAVVAADSVRTYVEEYGTQLPPASIVALGALVATELRRAEQKRDEFKGAWRRFTRKRTLEVCQEVLRQLDEQSLPLPSAVAT